MNLLAYIVRKALTAIPLVLGVTLISFFLMVYHGPDRTYLSAGKNPTEQQLAEIRHQLGYDRPFLARYIDFLGELTTLELGHSDATGEPVSRLISRTLPVTIALVLPGFLLGNLLGWILGMYAAWHRDQWIDRVVTTVSVAGMSLSFLVTVILLQVILCTPWGFNLFPTRGWDVHDMGSYLHYVAVPTLSLILVTVGYNTRFYRALVIEELARDHVLTARAYGAGPIALLLTHVLKNSLAPILTRLLFSVPLIIITGSLLLESFFGIPGIGKVTFDAITGGDQPVLKAVVSLTAIMLIMVQFAMDLIYRQIDPAVRAS